MLMDLGKYNNWYQLLRRTVHKIAGSVIKPKWLWKSWQWMKFILFLRYFLMVLLTPFLMFLYLPYQAELLRQYNYVTVIQLCCYSRSFWLWPSGLWHCVVLYVSTNILEEVAAINLRADLEEVEVTVSFKVLVTTCKSAWCQPRRPQSGCWLLW